MLATIALSAALGHGFWPFCDVSGKWPETTRLIPAAAYYIDTTRNVAVAIIQVESVEPPGIDFQISCVPDPKRQRQMFAFPPGLPAGKYRFTCALIATDECGESRMEPRQFDVVE